MYLKDKNTTEDNFSWLCISSNDTICYEDGTTKPLTTDQIVVTFGKYNGQLLSEISDIGYLQWLVKSATEKGDLWQVLVTNLRINELL